MQADAKVGTAGEGRKGEMGRHVPPAVPFRVWMGVAVPIEETPKTDKEAHPRSTNVRSNLPTRTRNMAGEGEK